MQILTIYKRICRFYNTYVVLTASFEHSLNLYKKILSITIVF